MRRGKGAGGGFRRRIRKVLFPFGAALCIPYVLTLGWTGSISGSEKVLERMGAGGEGTGMWEKMTDLDADPELSSGRTVILDREQVSRMDVEQYLVGVVAEQIPADFEAEALKCQAVIARTYIYRQMNGALEIPESALDMDYLGETQMEMLWGTADYMEFYRKIEQAVAATRGMVMTFEGDYIEPLFCRCSAGKTRPGDEAHPYLASVDCPEDPMAEGALQLKIWTPEEFSRLISSIPEGGPVSADQVPGTIQIAERDPAGYVTLVQIGSNLYTGDEVRYALGLASSFFRLEDYEGNIRGVVKGIGHGYGLSQMEANRKAAAGWTFDEILNAFYQNIVLVSE